MVSRGHGYIPGHVSAIIVCFNRLDLTRACYESILNSDDYPDEIIFVDNNSTDETPIWLLTAKAVSPVSVEIVTLTQNVGWGRGMNAGAALAEGEYLMSLNNDTEVSFGWLNPLKAELADPEVAAAAGRLVNPDGTLQHAGVTLWRDTNGTLTASNLSTEQPPGDVQCQAGAAQLIRASAFREVGGIDPLFRNGYEDVNLCLELRQLGWRLRYTPESTVMHHQHGSGPERWTHVQDNIRLLAERWKDLDVS